MPNARYTAEKVDGLYNDEVETPRVDFKGQRSLVLLDLKVCSPCPKPSQKIQKDQTQQRPYYHE